MVPVITDERLVDEILDRGVEKIYPSREELKKKLLSGDRIRLYAGFDPSSRSLHIGHAIEMIKLAQFQKLGHEVIFLIGGFTGMIGDPTDKAAARKKLTREEVMDNAQSFKEQASHFIDFEGANSAQVRYNNDWCDQVSFKDLIELASNFTVQQMIQRDMFQKRLVEEKPIFLHEFLYPLAQAYDSVVLDVDLEIGGNDQMFNMMCGRDLLKALKGKDKSVLTMKLLTDDTGKKMGKSEGNAVSLNEAPADVYGKVMSWNDGVMGSAFESCTLLPFSEVNTIKQGLKNGSLNPRDVKMRLALELTKIISGAAMAEEAQANFIKTVQNKEIPEEIEMRRLKETELNIVDLLILLELAPSKSEARRLIEQGGIRIGQQEPLKLITDVKELIKIDDGLIVQRGKRQFIRIIK
jgi:tyrosyl-tRNA synthetase